MAIRWDKFTIKSQEAIQKANDLAGQNGNPEMLPLHLLAALLQDREGIVVPVLTKLGVNPASLETQITERISRLPKVSGGAAQVRLAQFVAGLCTLNIPEHQRHLLFADGDDLLVHFDAHCGVILIGIDTVDELSHQAGLAHGEGPDHANLFLNHQAASLVNVGRDNPKGHAPVGGAIRFGYLVS